MQKYGNDLLSFANTLILVYWGIARKTLDDYGLETELGMEMADVYSTRALPPTAPTASFCKTTPTRDSQKSKDQKKRSNATGDYGSRRQDPTPKEGQRGGQEEDVRTTREKEDG